MTHQLQRWSEVENSMPSKEQTDLVIIPVRSFLDRILGRKGDCLEVPLASICDFKETRPNPLYRGLTLYVFDHALSLGEYRHVNKLKTINTIGLSKKQSDDIMSKIRDVTKVNKQLGVRKKDWFYTSMSVNLDFS